MYHFIVNPNASSQKGMKIWKQLYKKLQNEKVEFKVYFTMWRGHATKLARDISVNYAPCTVVAVGGDGTVNEVINGLENLDTILFGYIPTGSANDMARALKLSEAPTKILDCILKPTKIRKIDIGMAYNQERGRQSFLVSAGMGFDAAVCHEAMHSKIKDILNKVKLGKLTYLFIALKQIVTLKPFAAKIIMDGKVIRTYKKVFFVTVMNMKYEGGGLPICPDANPEDRYLDICVCEKLPLPRLIIALKKLFKGEHMEVKGVYIFRCKKIKIISNRKVAIHTDGEEQGIQKQSNMWISRKKLSFIVG